MDFFCNRQIESSFKRTFIAGGGGERNNLGLFFLGVKVRGKAKGPL